MISNTKDVIIDVIIKELYMFIIIVHTLGIMVAVGAIQFFTRTQPFSIQLMSTVGMLTLAMIGCYCAHYYKRTLYGTVVILNGPSVAGKSSIQKAFQDHMLEKEAWIKVGIDNLFDKPFPDVELERIHLWQSPNKFRWIENTIDKYGNPVMKLLVGPDGDKIAYGMNSAIAAYAKAGNNVIVDYIAYKQEWTDDLEKKLSFINHYWVKVDISLATLEAREKARATSPVGHSRSHYDTVHNGIKYDFVVNSEKNTAVQIAQEIEEFLKSKK